ncbi:glycosyltransferase family 2 protein [Photorhabdus heterorhabditis]|uniref:glycosyltransferase family 2 protein n=1 Tax=Photorhabdus heterorhabditis TaxID=880156 RepID=UPI00156255A8|nr:glycosyltransferase family 2 protein [Photorhabdus heterorhabditis]NRN30294.1 glycosyltransferase [Photorhabdus heterorhabditis subsp. aluminescens]
MKISIITATYNSEKTIADTLLSLEKQTYQNIEYIIIDGASKDSTLTTINKNSTRTTTIISEPDKGIYDALNKGIDIATGDVIGFLHSDDLFAYPEAITDIVATFEQHKCDAVYGDLQYVSRSNINNVVRHWKSGKFHPKKIQYGWIPPHPTFYMKRELYNLWGGFSLSFKIASDYDSMLRYIVDYNAKLQYLPKIIIKMRVGGESSRLENSVPGSKETIQIMRNHNIFWPIALIYRKISKLSQFLKKYYV